MNPAILRGRRKAFTLIELLVVIAMIAILMAVFFPAHRGPSKSKARLVMCLNNLRVVSIGYTKWAESNGSLFPWQVSTNTGGTMELTANGNAADHFVSLSTILTDPSLLTCPADRLRTRTNTYVGFSNTNLSYFVSLDVRPGNSVKTANLILAGDRHLSVSNQSVNSGMFATTNQTALGWRGGHPSRGVLAFADGHAEAVKADVLPSVFQRQAIATNRLVIP